MSVIVQNIIKYAKKQENTTHKEANYNQQTKSEMSQIKELVGKDVKNYNKDISYIQVDKC